VARNAGISAAQGDYLSFIDADDHFEPDMLKTAYDHCIEADADIAVFRCDLFDDSDGTVAPCSWGLRMDLLPPQASFSWRDIPEDIFRIFNGWAWDKLFRTSFVKKNEILFQSLKTTNDMFFVMSALVKAERIITIDRVLAHQRRNLKTSISQNREASWGCFYEALQALRGEVMRMGIFAQVERGFVNLALQHSLWQLNTITGPAYDLLYGRLKEEWFNQLGIGGRTEGYFFKPGWYRQYERIMSLDAETFRSMQKTRSSAAGAAQVGKRRLLQVLLHHIRVLGIWGTLRVLWKKWRQAVS
jgi:glycosyltransferase involved in cell wall biosynthesis